MQPTSTSHPTHKIVLNAKNASIHGKGAVYDENETRDCISRWNDVNTSLSWELNIEEAGEFEVLISQEVSYDITSGSYEIHIGQSVLRAELATDSDWEGFKEMDIGTVMIGKPDHYTVRLVPKMMPKPKFPDTRYLVLRRKSNEGEFTAPFTPIEMGESALFKHDIAVFYPQKYHAKKHGSSIALVKEPSVIGAVPDTWQVRPKFFSNGEKSRFTIDIAEGTSLYGTGEVHGDLERQGSKTFLYNCNNYGYDRYSNSLYQSHPWIMGVRKDGTAFGVIADTTWRSEISLQENITFTSEAPEFRVIIIDRESPQAVLKGLAEMTGTMDLPPLWALGYQQCRFSYFPDEKVRRLADEFRERKIPCDVIWIDIDYMDGYRVFTFDEEKFPHPEETNRYIKSKGFKGVWMIDPGVKVEKGYGIFDSGMEEDVWVKTKDGEDYQGQVWPGKCVFPDYTRPETQKWWADLHKDFMSYGIDGIWNDVNEPSVKEETRTMPDDNWHRGGEGLLPGPHVKYHNVYGMLMVKATRDGILAANPDKRPFVLTRASHLGGHRYAATWTGDNRGRWDHLKMSIPMSLNLGLSGQPFNGPDVGGFAGRTEADLFGHWISLGAFYPFSRGHANKGTNDKEPWQFGPEVEEVSRTALQRRYRLMPYFYTLFHEASQNGMPVMRPAFFADPRDASLREEDEAFLLGKDLLIIPKWAEGTSLPKGYAHSVSLVGEDAGGDPYQCDIRIRSGSIVPLTKVMQSTTEFDHKDLTLMICLDEKGEAEGQLYEDANDGFGYQKGEFRFTTFKAKQSGDGLIITQSNEGNFATGQRDIKVEWITGQGVKKSRTKESKRMTFSP